MSHLKHHATDQESFLNRIHVKLSIYLFNHDTHTPLQLATNKVRWIGQEGGGGGGGEDCYEKMHKTKNLNHLGYLMWKGKIKEKLPITIFLLLKQQGSC